MAALRLIDFGDDEQWHAELRENQLALPIDLPPTVPARVPPPVEPRARRVEDADIKEDLL
jgi:hypothetical protein